MTEGAQEQQHCPGGSTWAAAAAAAAGTAPGSPVAAASASHRPMLVSPLDTAFQAPAKAVSAMLSYRWAQRCIDIDLSGTARMQLHTRTSYT
jgi:hypothetical protein